MPAKIESGVWTRNVPWKQQNGEWRADIFKSVLADPRLRECHFILKDGPTLIVPADELRRVLVGGPDHYAGKIWGPFNLNPRQKNVAGVAVQMTSRAMTQNAATP